MRQARRIPWSQQAILFQTNIQSRPLETALRQAGVRYHLVGGQSFFDRREVRDFLAYLKVFLNPNDDVSLLRIANVPARGLTDVTMERLLAASQERKCSVFSAMKNPLVESMFQTRTQEAIQGFMELINKQHIALGSDPNLVLSQWADSFLESVGYYAELKRGEKDQEVAEARIRNIKDLLPDLEDAG